MKTRKKVLTVGTIVFVLILTVAGSVLAFGYSSDRSPTTVERELDMGPNNAPVPPNMCGRLGFEAAANVLGMSSEDLRIQLWGGRTLADVADQAGVDLKDVYTAVRQACEQPIRDAIARAVENKRISQEEADWLLEGLDKGYWGPNAQNPILNRLCAAFGQKPPARPAGTRFERLSPPASRHFTPRFPNRWNR